MQARPVTGSRLPLLFAIAALLPGCAATLRTSPAAVPAGDVSVGDVPVGDAYFALGSDPDWTLEITDNRITVNRAGRAQVRTGKPPAQFLANGVRYQMDGITILVVEIPCDDSISDRRFADTVTVTISGQTLVGCGGVERPMPNGSLNRTTWRITAVNGQPADRGVYTELNFYDGRLFYQARISGISGCNRVLTTYTQARNQLRIEGAAITCPQGNGAQQNAVIAILNQRPLTVVFGARSTATLTAADGTNIALRRMD